ncbi:UvrB/UvrC motif-containing protein [Sphingomonas crusticola]|uniref:UvrB/UvrC motif-containing protein n=1 Tax=Sphingomonas crusticola TaxID=1697973 RepID=UPI000E28138E|nr:UvrB/UvrC motif-containing protein [Sphingomonas crusticola]
MTDKIQQLRVRMEEAAAALDFEEARRLRDQLSIARGGGAGDDAEADVSGLTRQQPGRMGLGTSQQRMTPPPGWRPPAKPDPMTRGRGKRRS